MGNIAFSLVSAGQLQRIHNYTSHMESIDRVIQVSRIIRLVIFEHNELANLVIKVHMSDIQAGQVSIFHMVLQMHKFIDLLCTEGRSNKGAMRLKVRHCRWACGTGTRGEKSLSNQT